MILKRSILLMLNLFYPQSSIGKAIHYTYGIYRELIRNILMDDTHCILVAVACDQDSLTLNGRNVVK